MIGIATSPIRGLVHWLFGLALLGTLWVTAITSLSARPNATLALTDLGAQALNPYLVAGTNGTFGVSQANYPVLQREAQAQPDQPLILPGLKVQVLGREIAGLSYADGVRVIYGHVADAYYDGGASAVFGLPQQYTQLIDTYGVFALPSGALPGGSSTSGQGSSGSSSGGQSSLPQVPQIPTFLQPIFYSLGLSPSTLTAAGHERIASTLAWWWTASVILGLLAIVFNAGASRVRPVKENSPMADRALGSLGPLKGPVEAIFRALAGGARRISSVGWAIFHAGWPGVLIPGLMWLLALYIFPTQLKPYTDILGLITRVFVPVYGAGMVIGLVIVLAPWLALGVLLLLAALAGALAIFGLRPKPATQPYPASPPAPVSPSGRAPARQAGHAGQYDAQSQYDGYGQQAVYQRQPPSAPDVRYGAGHSPNQGYRQAPQQPQAPGNPSGPGGYPQGSAGGYGEYGGYRGVPMGDDDPSANYPPQRGGYPPQGNAGGRYPIPNRRSAPDVGRPQPGRGSQSYGAQDQYNRQVQRGPDENDPNQGW